MKKIIFTLSLVLLSLFAFQASAQNVRFGIKGGYNAATWEGDAMKSLDNVIQLADGNVTTEVRSGFHGGMYIDLPIGTNFYIEPGVYYSQKGMRFQGRFSSERFDFLNLKATITDKAEYIDVPLLGKLFVAEGLHFFAGPQMSFLVSNKINTRASVVGFNLINKDFNYDSPFRKTDFGLVGGLGYRLNNGLNFSVGYDHGLNRIDKGGHFNTYNRVVKASIGFDF
ncbi:porin family protein [Adhaeribacter aquaticus]|uniref:porin family protein n=1 Tax=Adhaeribacter aquaticus TaxID=299567 RepID=UPI0004102A1D|nr:porin family protein [Adhaeribacter aquaticus]